MTPLTSATSLILDPGAHRICDTRWALTDPDKGRSDYLAAHIPGAVFVDLDADLAAPPGDTGRHPLPSTHEFAATLGRLGIGPDTSVVVYDDAGGRIAARLWWMLVSIGHRRVAVLDGGLQAWVAAGGTLETGDVVPHRTTYPVPARFDGAVERAALDGRAVVDARAEDRYRG
ncbi:MAG: rhodanese-like domain-containing protein, partial [Acidimicrobiia bacterium]